MHAHRSVLAVAVSILATGAIVPSRADTYPRQPRIDIIEYAFPLMDFEIARAAVR